MNKKVLLIIGGVALVFCLLCTILFVVVFALGIGATQPAATAGENFMTALKNGDYNQAYGLCSPALQRELGNAGGLGTRIRNGKVEPTAWSFSSRNISNDTGELTGTVTFTGNREGTVRLVLAQVGGEWKISGFNLREK
ncbi:MAG: hypothetical protein FJ009_13080 [Chloroflexi bacterium]|nr:hypothetical protein [Chloroflexota bacterium]